MKHYWPSKLLLPTRATHQAEGLAWGFAPAQSAVDDQRNRRPPEQKGRAMPPKLPRLTLPFLVLLPLAGCGRLPGQDTAPDAGKYPGARAGAKDLPAGLEGNRNVRFGLPAPAGKDPEKDREASLIERPQYVLSYNAKTRTPNWVSWELKKDDIGSVKRAAFEPDQALTKGSPSGRGCGGWNRACGS
jgi:hypothetical protein